MPSFLVTKKIDIGTWLSRVENLQARLKWSVSPSKIIRWLENFDVEHIDDAYDFLLFLEYVGFEELQSRLDEQLQRVIDEVGTETPILIVPYGKFGKSGPMIGYPIKNTTAYSKHNKIDLDWDFRSRNIDSKTAIVFIDDFVGTGKTFIKQYQEPSGHTESISKWLAERKVERQYLLAAIIMDKGKKEIERKLGSTIRIMAEIRNGAFDPSNSVFDVTQNRERLRSLIETYGTKFAMGPFGYGNSEALVAFAHTTPNNTLPIIWDQTDKWFPIFPRKSGARIESARSLKKEIAFHIAVMNRLGLHLYDLDRSTFKNGKRVLQYNHRTDHSLLTYIKLKKEAVNPIIICQVIGVTTHELKEIIKDGAQKGLLRGSGELTPLGHGFFDRLTRKVRRFKFRSKNPENYKPKNKVYAPKTFKGVA